MSVKSRSSTAVRVWLSGEKFDEIDRLNKNDNNDLKVVVLASVSAIAIENEEFSSFQLKNFLHSSFCFRNRPQRRSDMGLLEIRTNCAVTRSRSGGK